MGRSYTPKYVVDYYDQAGKHTTPWICKTMGRVTAENLEKWRQKMNQSFRLMGCNHHVSVAQGVIVHIHEASIRLNRPVVPSQYAPIVTVRMPMFEEI